MSILVFGREEDEPSLVYNGPSEKESLSSLQIILLNQHARTQERASSPSSRSTACSFSNKYDRRPPASVALCQGPLCDDGVGTIASCERSQQQQQQRPRRRPRRRQQLVSSCRGSAADKLSQSSSSFPLLSARVIYCACELGAKRARWVGATASAYVETLWKFSEKVQEKADARKD